MKKKITDEDVAKFIGEIAKIVSMETEELSKDAYERVFLAITNEKYKEMDRAEIEMYMAESKLCETYNEEQKKLYADYYQKREDFRKKEKVIFEKVLRDEFRQIKKD